MFKKVFISLFILLLATACMQKEAPKETEVKEEITVVNVDNFLETAPALVDKKVKVEGTIVHTCKHGGKRAHIIGTDPDVKLKLETTDLVEKFNKEMEGSGVVAEGIVKSLIIDEAYLVKWEAEIKETGESGQELHEGHQKEHDQMTEQEENLAKIKAYRKQLAESGKEKLEFYWVDLSKYEIKKG